MQTLKKPSLIMHAKTNEDSGKRQLPAPEMGPRARVTHAAICHAITD